MASANREMAVYCFDTLVSHYNNEEAPPPEFDEANQYVSLNLSIFFGAIQLPFSVVL